MARRLLGIGAFLITISIFSIIIVVAIHWVIRFAQYIDYHGSESIINFLLWPLRNNDVSYRWFVFAGWAAFFIGFIFVLLHMIVSLVTRFFRPSILIEVPSNPEYRKEGSKIIAVIPAFEEADTIGEVILGTRKYVDEIVVINDGSQDQTGNIAVDLGTHLINHDIQKGLGITMRDGLDTAIDLGADIIVTLDADGQYVPEEIPNVIYPITQGLADLVMGSRSAGTIEEMPFVKRFGNRMMTWVVGMIAKLRFTDTQTGFRAMTSHVAQSLDLTGQYTYTQEMALQTVRSGYRVVDVPITFRKRRHGKSRLITTSADYAFRSIAIVLRTMRNENPLVFFGSGGLLLMAVGGYIVGDAAIQWSQRAPIEPYTVILAFLFVSVGLQILLFGFVADMLRKERFVSRSDRLQLSKLQAHVKHIEEQEDQFNHR